MSESTGQAKPASDLFYDAFRSSPIGIVLEDLEGRVLFVNPAFCSMLGFSEEEMLSKHCVDFSPAEDAEKDWALFQQLRAGSIDQYHLDKRYFRRDGSLVWGRLSISLLNDRPSPLVIAMVEDITDKMVAQETLELATQEMVGVTRCSRDFRYMWVSQGYAKWLQRPSNEIVGRRIMDVLGKSAFEALLPHFERALAGGKASYEEEVSLEGLGRRWVSATYTPAFDPAGKADGWVAVVVDITERKLAEEEQQRHAAIVKSTDDAIFSGNLAGLILSWNQGAQNLFGYTEAEVIGRPITIIVPDALQEEARDILDRVRKGEHIQRFETARVTKEGKRIDVSLTISPINDATGKVVSVCTIARDITERKHTEAIVSGFSQRLIQAQEQERAAVARELHDDVNQRVALAALNLEALISDVAFSTEAKSEITGVMKQLRELAGDIQALSYRLHSSKLEQLGLRAAAASFCREVSAKNKVKVEFQSKDVPENLPNEISLCLFRVMQEALQNSAKHSGSTHVQVSLSRESGEMQLMVRDSGKGFVLQEAVNETGIGLASMTERLKLVNGQLSIQSEPGRGTAVFARVPFRAASKSSGANA